MMSRLLVRLLSSVVVDDGAKLFATFCPLKLIGPKSGERAKSANRGSRESRPGSDCGMAWECGSAV